MVVGGALCGSSDVSAFGARRAVESGFASVGLIVSWGLTFVTSSDVFAVPGLLSCQRNEDDLGRMMGSANIFSAGNERSRSGDCDGPSNMNDIRSANLDRSIIVELCAGFICNVSSEGTMNGPA